jgi:hypothetical protein
MILTRKSKNTFNIITKPKELGSTYRFRKFFRNQIIAKKKSTAPARIKVVINLSSKKKIHVTSPLRATLSSS